MAYPQRSRPSIYRQRRRRRAAITLTLVAVMMLGTFAYAAAYFRGWVGGDPAPKAEASAGCQVASSTRALRPSAVAINVYNSTNRQGLAASVAKSLRTQGFQVQDVANDPLGKQIAGVGEVRHGRTGTAGAALAAARLSGAKVVADKRTDATVDLVLGNRFTALRAPPKVTTANATKAPPSPPTDSC